MIMMSIIAGSAVLGMLHGFVIAKLIEQHEQIDNDDEIRSAIRHRHEEHTQ